MPKTPYKTSDQIIETIKRRIMFPISQVTFTDDDLLEFVNDELMGSQVPSVLQYHEEYFVFRLTVPLETDQVRYPIPDRAIGMRLRGIFYEDSNGQLYDMTRINPDDQGFFLNATDASSTPYKYFLENNDVVLSDITLNQPSGSLVMLFYLRPNQLVKDENAAIISSFQKSITVSNTSLVAGDTLTIGDLVLTAVSGTPGTNEFQIGASSIATTTNIATAINDEGSYEASNGTPATATLALTYTDITTLFSTSNSVAFVIPNTQTIVCDDGIPDSFENSTYYDVLQTKPGHRTYNYDVLVENNSISGSTMTFPEDSLPNNVVIGDYICNANECIIPQLPPELHNVLIERACARILAALGDTENLGTTNQKIQEMELRQGNMIDNRVDGNPQIVLPRRSLLRFGKLFR